MNWLRCVLVLLLGAAGSFASPDVRANTSCEADMTDLDFGLVDPTDRTTTATIDYRCDTKGGDGAQTTVRMCFAIGAGIASGSTESDRRMTNLFDSLPFGIYKDASHTESWGDDAAPPRYLEHPISYSLNPAGNGKASGRITVHGYIPDLWGAAAGLYGSYFGDTELTFRYNDDGNPANDPVSCDSGPGEAGSRDRFPFFVWADLPRRCDVRATRMDFGTIYNSASTGNLTSTSTISLECTNRMAWRVGLNNGLHFNGSSRQLCSGSACVPYQLNRPPGDGGGPWGNTSDADTVDGTSDQEELTVNGVISDQPVPQAGIYSDTITVIVTY